MLEERLVQSEAECRSKEEMAEFMARELDSKIRNTEAEYEKIIAEIRTQLDEQRNEYNEQIAELKSKVKEAEEYRASNESEVSKKLAEYESKLRKQQEISMQELDDSKSQVKSLKEEIKEMDKAYKVQLKEHEAKAKEERQVHIEEIETVQNELKESENQHQAMIEQLEHENRLLQQKLETQEVNIRGIKDQSAKFQSMTSTALEQQLESFTKERKSLLDEIDRMSKIIVGKGEQLNKLQSKVQDLVSELQAKERSVEELRRNKLEERNTLIERLENLKLKNQKISNEYTQKKFEFNKESALASQHVLLIYNR
eukprot:TRINITY_DN4827_c0_g4_i1.p1 TRINITY_DN4827_c0_g4~~TRINITY_DN4827_c0_g4_i1.p1  ORF type:complete len:313 (+),score=95.22 TRINITY_DN4827_c0_g4_i1:113-1051(+)